jgi:hypothetical protein
VRRAFLCGEDALTGRCLNQRQDWIETRLLELASSFSPSALACTVMSNHVHGRGSRGSDARSRMVG